MDTITVHPDEAEFLKAKGLLTLKSLIGCDQGEVVSRHDYRCCRKVTLEDGKVIFLRQERRIPWMEVWEDLFHFRKPVSRAVKTLQAVKLLEEKGIEAPRVMAVIERRYFGRPIKAAAVQAQARGTELYSYLLSIGRAGERRINTAKRKRLMYELGVFLAKLQMAKIDWADLSGKHIFVNEAGDGRFDFELIDVERMRKGLTNARRQKQLHDFFYSLRGVIGTTDVIRVLMGYIGLDKARPVSVRRKLWEKFFPKGGEWLSEFRQEMRIRRAMPDNQPLPEEETYERINGLVVNTRFKDVVSEQGLLEPGKIFSFKRGSELYKPGLGRRFRMRFEATRVGVRNWFYLKRVHHPGLGDQIDRILCGSWRISSCRHEQKMIKALGLCRIPTPIVVAWAEKMFGCYERASALVTLGLIGQSLEVYVPKYFSRAADRVEIIKRRKWIRKLAELIGRFHRNGFCHRDLYLSHIFIGFRKDGEPIFYLIDLARCFKMGMRRQRWIIKDLSALNFSSPMRIISRTDRMRFLLTYLEKAKLDAKDKKLVKKILTKCERIERHNLKHKKVTKERAVK